MAFARRTEGLLHLDRPGHRPEAAALHLKGREQWIRWSPRQRSRRLGLVVESFVDETRYRGTCYRACGFEAVGLTEGYRRASRDFYHEHGQPKQLYLRELRPGARATLRRGRLPPVLAEHEEKIAGPCPWRAGELGSLLERFRVLRDPPLACGAPVTACAIANLSCWLVRPSPR